MEPVTLCHLARRVLFMLAGIVLLLVAFSWFVMLDDRRQTLARQSKLFPLLALGRAFRRWK